MLTVGIDIGGRRHALARCREGEAKADREILWVTEDRAGFDRLDGWLARQDEPVGLVAMESSGHYWMARAAHLQQRGIPRRGGQSARGEVRCQEPPRTHEVRPGRCTEPRPDGHA